MCEDLRLRDFLPRYYRGEPLKRLWWAILDFFPCAWAYLHYRLVCSRHGHLWGRDGSSFDGEYTSHWAECSRCGYMDSD